MSELWSVPEELLPLPPPPPGYTGWEYMGTGYRGRGAGPEGIYAVNYPEANSGWMTGQCMDPDGDEDRLPPVNRAQGHARIHYLIPII